MSDGQSHAERLAQEALGALDDMTKAWRVPPELRAVRPVFLPRADADEKTAAREARQAIAAEQAADLELAKLDRAEELVEARAALRAAWAWDSVAWALSAALGAAFTWAALR